ncbi:MAG: CDGSH iron-sulfur domain-containing protein [Stellaceae bacterium]
MSTAKNNACVTVTKDGPYVVSGAVPLMKQTIGVDAEGGSEKWIEGKQFVTEAEYALCRCGHSKSKPFCDGSHEKVHFDGGETASRAPYRQQARTFAGPAMNLTDADSLCAFARFCDPHGKVWNQVRHTDSPQTRAIFVRQVADCPSGRLAAWDKATGHALEPHLPVSIGVVDDPAQHCGGPLWLRGGIQVIAAEGFAYEVRNRVTLCRCGQSKNKPFCDGTHAAIKFRGE